MSEESTVSMGRAGAWKIRDFDVYREKEGIITVIQFESGVGIPAEFGCVLTDEGAKALMDKLKRVLGNEEVAMKRYIIDCVEVSLTKGGHLAEIPDNAIPLTINEEKDTPTYLYFAVPVEEVKAENEETGEDELEK